MKGRVLMEVKPSEYRDYIEEFKTVTSNPKFLSKENFESILKPHNEKAVGKLEAKEHPVIAMVLEKCMDYKKMIEIGLFEGIEKETSWASRDKLYTDWLIVNHLKGKYGIGIGSLDNRLEVFETYHGNVADQYGFRPGKTNWFEPSKNFLKNTYEILKPEDKKSWSILESIFS